MNAWLPQASYPCGNFSDTSSCTFHRHRGSVGHAFTVRIRTENRNQASFSPSGLHEISGLIELALGHLRYLLTDVPPQPNSPPDYVSRTDLTTKVVRSTTRSSHCETQFNGVSKATLRVVVFHWRVSSHLFYIPYVNSQSRTRVKLNRVFFPRCLFQARSLGCGFAR